MRSRALEVMIRHLHASPVVLMLGAQFARVASAQNAQSSREPMVQSVLAATVAIKSATVNDTLIGSGFVVDPSGIIVTAAHVIRGSIGMQVRFASGRLVPVAGILYQDSATDVAIIKATAGNLPYLHLSRDTPAVGERLLAVGSPLGLDFTVSDGLLSAQRLVDGRRLLQISVPVSPGSSGGPVVAENGAAVGLVVSGVLGGGAENLNFALPISYVTEVLPIVRAQQPTPVALSQRGSGGAPSAEQSGRAPKVVNEAVRFEWRSLDGVEMYLERQVNPEWRAKILTRYAASVDPTGAPILERQESATFEYRRQAFLAQWTPVYREDTRTLLGLSRHGHVDVFATRVPLQPHVPSGEWELSISDSLLIFSSSGRELVRKMVPVGVLPISLQGAALAALPDSLGDVTYLWEVGADSTRASVMPVEVRREGTTQVRVRVPDAGQHCSESARTEERTVTAWRLEISVGASASDVLVSASAPHLVVNDGECVLAAPLRNH